MSDDEYTYDKLSVLDLVDTSAAGLFVTEATSKMVLCHTDAGETEGDDDELEVRFGISNRDTKTNQRRKVQMPDTETLCPPCARAGASGRYLLPQLCRDQQAMQSEATTGKVPSQVAGCEEVQTLAAAKADSRFF